jgi:hypothetical protein
MNNDPPEGPKELYSTPRQCKGERQHSEKRYRGVLPSKNLVFLLFSNGKRFMSPVNLSSSSKEIFLGVSSVLLMSL